MLAAIAQLQSTKSIFRNLAKCKELIIEAAAKGASCIFFPEASDFIAENVNESVELTSTEENKKFLQGICEQAIRSKIHVNICVHEASECAGKIYNSNIWIEPTRGTIAARYHKVHLFDVDLGPGKTFKESNSTMPGTEIPSPVMTPLGKVGLAICFDLRFPELAQHLRSKGADILVYPSAFTEKTGAAHWETLLRARAIDSQCFVVAAAQHGAHNAKRTSYGHSMVIDPWGTVIAQYSDMNTPEGLLLFDVNLSIAERVRRAIPLARRNDLYPKL
ncbi:bis(5'-adenosyl)-triphosphatase [Schizosaccharomyces japonicus yFS275]|uniref:Bis(5'-adenosyl)-triphosphatase n=1 Tax=Schizosaccharomyces japonicus (strain yFS275 / FY16936) TaxID=402676 RepID=B6K863_SCHJY|nr:bis(5'-adenosyl)-triphosphatase [Schizosaccharomyces japonicus yFS275]EEB09717.1 bis(5'-adenosyl)-triphosphatase [Schizosaccharomyces japonicus yFS275]